MPKKDIAELPGGEQLVGQADDADPGEAPEGEPEQSFLDVWAAVDPGRVSKGAYSVYKDEGGSLIIAYRPDGDGADAHLTIPAGMIRLMSMAAEGKGPFGKLAAFAARRQAG